MESRKEGARTGLLCRNIEANVFPVRGLSRAYYPEKQCQMNAPLLYKLLRKPGFPIEIHTLASGSGHELVDISNIDVLLLLHIRAGRRAMVRPTLEFQKKQYKEWQDGESVDPDDSMVWDHGDVHDPWDENVDFTVATATHIVWFEFIEEYLVCLSRLFRRPEVELSCACEELLELFSCVLARHHDDIDILNNISLVKALTLFVTDVWCSTIAVQRTSRTPKETARQSVHCENGHCHARHGLYFLTCRKAGHILPDCVSKECPRRGLSTSRAKGVTTEKKLKP